MECSRNFRVVHKPGVHGDQAEQKPGKGSAKSGLVLKSMSSKSASTKCQITVKTLREIPETHEIKTQC